MNVILKVENMQIAGLLIKITNYVKRYNIYIILVNPYQYIYVYLGLWMNRIK